MMKASILSAPDFHRDPPDDRAAVEGMLSAKGPDAEIELAFVMPIAYAVTRKPIVPMTCACAWRRPDQRSGAHERP